MSSSLPNVGNDERTLSAMSQDRGRLAGHRAYGVRFMGCEPMHRNSSPNNVGHRRGFIAVGVLLGRVSVSLRKESTSTLGKTEPHSRKYGSRLGVASRNKGMPKRVRLLLVIANFRKSLSRSDKSQLLARCLGEPADCRIGMTRSRTNRKRLSADRGTWEARSSKEVRRDSRSVKGGESSSDETAGWRSARSSLRR